jgi:hypothetical protein
MKSQPLPLTPLMLCPGAAEVRFAGVPGQATFGLPVRSDTANFAPHGVQATDPCARVRQRGNAQSLSGEVYS